MAFPISGSFTTDQIERLNSISNDKANEIRKKSQVLDKDAFLKLMMVQLQNQNPLDPTDNAEYMAQMAQFSSVEQLANISSSIENTNSLNSLISKQLEDLHSLVEGMSKGDGGEKVESGNEALLAQNTKILEELMKMNAMLSTYIGQNSNDDAVEDNEIFNLLGQM
ncbi:MAG: flagellar hook capping FlgD N-terminal domain-containing protein [Bacillota bacterium]|nr:flagellar hook capping FlgD N-terminal domain-containing protein [Bacillota bacterium]